MRKKTALSILLSLVVLLSLGLTPIAAQEAWPSNECCHYYCDFSRHLQEIDALGQLLNALGMTTIDELEAYTELVGYIDVTDLLGPIALPPMGSLRSVSRLEPEITPFCTPPEIVCGISCLPSDWRVNWQGAILRDGRLVNAWIIWCHACFAGRSATDSSWRCMCSSVDWNRTHFFAR